MNETGKPWHVLVVDDEEHNVDMLSRRLRRRGYTVSTALSAKEAKEQVFLQLPDIILLDIMMPEVTGIELLVELRNTDTTAHLPVILVSALGETDDIVKGLEMGANDYVTKPIDLPVLIARMEAQLKRAAILASSQRQVALLKRLAEVDAALIKTYEEKTKGGGPAQPEAEEVVDPDAGQHERDTADYDVVESDPDAYPDAETAQYAVHGNDEQITIEEVIFSEALTQEVQTQITKTYWSNNPLSIMIMDLELEMNLSDGYGETDAEDLLRQFVKQASTFFDEESELRRLDWGMFCVFLHDCDEAAAVTIANGLLELISSSIFERAVIKATGKLFIGLATYDPRLEGSSPDLAERGRMALKAAKDHGRSIWVAP